LLSVLNAGFKDCQGAMNPNESTIQVLDSWLS
jgi:hypothetical protein